MAARGPARTPPGLLFLCPFLLLLVGVLAAQESWPHDTSSLHTTGRRLAQADNSSTPPSTTTSDRTVRADPLKNLHKYRGGYDITKKHYWSSVVFTGIHGYALAILWLLVGVVYATFRLLATCFCAGRRKRDAKLPPCTTRRPRLWPAVTAVLLTVFVIVASCVALAGSSRFHSSARSIRRIIGRVGGEASATVTNITGALSAMEANPVAFAQVERITRLNATSQRLTQEAFRIQDKAQKSVRLIGKGLKILQTTTVVIVSFNILALLALLGSRFLRLDRTLRILLIVCWLTTSFFWLFFGLYFFLGGFAGDTCTALADYRQDPRNSSLSSILPCSNQSSADSALRATRAGIYNLINRVNANISAIQTSAGRRSLGLICNPFSPPPTYRYQPDRCSENTTRIGDIPQVLRGFTCSGTGEGSGCSAGQFISAQDFDTITIYTASVQTLLDSFPGVERIVDCQLVKTAFSEVLFNHCLSLRRYAKMSWASMAAVSSIMVLLALTWVVIQACTWKSLGPEGSVVPRDCSPQSTPDRNEMTDKTLPEL